jgi:hypothetical protein
MSNGGRRPLQVGRGTNHDVIGILEGSAKGDDARFVKDAEVLLLLYGHGALDVVGAALRDPGRGFVESLGATSVQLGPAKTPVLVLHVLDIDRLWYLFDSGHGGRCGIAQGGP